MTLDNKLTFTPHVKKARKKAFMAVGALHSLIGRQSTLKIKNKLILFNMIVKPIMLYATPIWGNTCNSNIKTLQIVQK